MTTLTSRVSRESAAMPRPESGARSIDAVDAAGRSAVLNSEWLLTNGLGGFAMGTLLGANTRRYHALLIASLSPPVRRVVALHSLIEQLVIGERQIELATHQFGHDLTLHPDGFQRLTALSHHAPDRVAWTWQIDGATITRELHLVPNCHAADITYTIRDLRQPAMLRIRPMTPLRDFHGLMREGDRAPGVSLRGKTGLLLRHNDIAMMIDAFSPGGTQPSPGWKIEPDWWRSFAYAVDRDRGQDWMEDLWSPGVVELHLDASVEHDRVILIRVNVAVESLSGTMWMGGQGEKAKPIEASGKREPSVSSRLRAAAAQFIVARRNASTGGSSTTVIAGYPWFADWGRDTMISLPGLMLATGRLDEARSTLLTFARSMSKGLLPNLFNDYGGASEYNTVDASLWFVHAVHELWRAGGGAVIDPELLQACQAIVHAYRHGTDFNIRMEPDALIAAGDPTTQLTWMDAKRDGVAFTPRHGKPVEINALWHHALLCLAAMTDNKRERDDFTQLAARVAESFRARFWWAEMDCLHDVLTPNAAGTFAPDGCLRPNQIFAVSLPHSPLHVDQQKAVVRTVGERLLTPFGLRTLDPEHPMYRGRYEGDLYRRDSSYHQGTAWPWLIGPFCEALLRVEQFSVKSKHEVRRIITPLLHELDAPGRGCLDQIAEVYDGDEPHRPSGCPAQAWSVAEVLRVYSMIEGD